MHGSVDKGLFFTLQCIAVALHNRFKSVMNSDAMIDSSSAAPKVAFHRPWGHVHCSQKGPTHVGTVLSNSHYPQFTSSDSMTGRMRTAGGAQVASALAHKSIASGRAARERREHSDALARSADVAHVRWLRMHTAPNGHLPPTVRDDVALPSFIARVNEWGGELSAFRRLQERGVHRKRLLLAAAEGHAAEARTFDGHGSSVSMRRATSDTHTPTDGGATVAPPNARAPHPPGVYRGSGGQTVTFFPHPPLSRQVGPSYASDRSGAAHYGLYAPLRYRSPGSPRCRPDAATSVVPRASSATTPANSLPQVYSFLERRRARRLFYFDFEREQLDAAREANCEQYHGTLGAAETAGETQSTLAVDGGPYAPRNGVVSLSFPFPLF